MSKRTGSRNLLETILLALVVVLPLVGVAAYLNYRVQPEAPAGAVAPSARVAPPRLALTDPAALPTKVAPTQVVPFSFTIANPGTTAATYQYEVAVVWKTGERDVIDVNPITVAAGGSALVHESLKFEQAGEVAHVTVEAGDPAQSLTFKLPRTP